MRHTFRICDYLERAAGVEKAGNIESVALQLCVYPLFFGICDSASESSGQHEYTIDRAVRLWKVSVAKLAVECGACKAKNPLQSAARLAA